MTAAPATHLSPAALDVHEYAAHRLAKHYLANLRSFRELPGTRLPTLAWFAADLATRCAIGESFAFARRRRNAFRLKPRWDLIARLAETEIRGVLITDTELASKLLRIRSIAPPQAQDAAPAN